MDYTTIQHPRTGEVYAVEIDDDGQIARATGPLHPTDPRDPQSVEWHLDNQDEDETREDAAWLKRELAIEEHS